LKKLKIILLFSILLYISFIIKNEIYFIKYKNENEIIGIVTKVNNYDNYSKLEIKSKEKILCIYNSNIDIKLGTKIKITGILKEPDTNTNFNLFNYKKYLLSKKIKWIFEIEKYEMISDNISIIYKIKNIINYRIEKSKNKDYLKLFILGENELDGDIKTKFQTLGISHLFAISGMHISLLTGILMFLLNKINKNEKLNILIISLFLLFYMFLTNYSPSIIRASFLFILINIKKIFKLKINNENILIIILICLLLYNPYYVYNLGFLFSFTISYFLIKYNNLLNNKNYVSSLFFTSFISFLVSIPIMINGFNQINLTSIIYNCFFVPYVSIIVFPLSLLSFIFPFLEPMFSLTIFLLELFSDVCSNFNLLLIFPKLSYFLIIIYYFLIINLLNNFKLIKLILLILFLLIISNYKYFINYTTITMLDVGQGDSILIELPHNKNILIDTGGIVSYYGEDKHNIGKNILIPYFKTRGIKQIDYLILSHGDYDHMGEAEYLVNNFKIMNVIFNNDNFNYLEVNLIKILDNKNILYYQNIKELSIDNNKLYFLNNKDYGNENDNSSVIYTKLNNHKFLFMGDAGVEVEKDLLENIIFKI